AESVGDVREMAMGGRVVAVLDGRVQVLDLPAAHRLEEAPPGAAGRDLDVEAGELLGSAAALRVEMARLDHALVGVVLVLDAEVVALLLPHQAAHLEEEQR